MWNNVNHSIEYQSMYKTSFDHQMKFLVCYKCNVVKHIIKLTMDRIWLEYSILTEEFYVYIVKVIIPDYYFPLWKMLI